MHNRNLLSPWIWKMAWRDSRSNRAKLLLFMSSIVLGVAALVAINSFGTNLERAIDDQARNLLGADLSISSRQPFSEEAQELVESIGGEQSRQTNFSSMAYFPRTEDFRLVQVRALDGGFPYYGDLKTDPVSAASAYRQGPRALVDDTLMRQFQVKVGDTLRLGEFSFSIAGRLIEIPGESLVVSLASPRVFIPLEYLDKTGLVQAGGRIGYRVFFRLDSETDAEELVEDLKPEFERMRLRSDTIEETKRDLGRAMTNLYSFLNMVGFIALLLGALGVASAIHVYVRQKVSTVAVLRCLGCSSRQTMAVYVIQAAVLGLFGSALGSLLGIGVQYYLPYVLADFMPLNVEYSVSPRAVLLGGAIGLGMAILFALLPLLPIRKIPPLSALRVDYEHVGLGRDYYRWGVYLMIALAILTFAIANSRRWFYGVYFFLGLVVAFGLLALVAKLIVFLVKRFFPKGWRYVWRQGLANLYRPHNQTVLLMLAIGLGTFLIVTLHLVQQTLLSQAALTGAGSRPNLVLFDIQTDQKEEIENLIRTADLPILQNVPIVTMRLAELQGRSVQDLRQDENRTQSRWALGREYRSTYRAQLIDTETVLEGRWQGQSEGETDIPVSLEERIAQELDLKIGDSLVFDVQGVPVKARVGSIRRVDWERVQPNFFAVFPTGVLEKAPQFHVLVTRTESVEQSAQVQRSVIQRFPNVSTIDLALILSTIDNILDRVSFVIRFMSLFSILTGLIVLAGAVISSRYQRIRETILLRTLGASRRQILKIMFIEYFFLGAFAAATGLVLALGAGWALAAFLFETSFRPDLLPIFIAFTGVTGLTIFIGLLNSRSVLDSPPLEVLRREG